MPYAFALPTTSSISLGEFFASPSHPSLILTATTHRSVLRDALKAHKRLPASSQAAHLSTVQEALSSYLPYLPVLSAGLLGHSVDAERVQVVELKQLETEWRLTLSSTLAGREPARVKLHGLRNELAFVLQTLAYVHTLLARTQLYTLYSAASPAPDQRAAAVSAAMKSLLDANSIHAYTISIPSPPAVTGIPVDTTPSTQSALASLALAEASLIVILKDDPYALAVVEDRNKDNKDWMIKAPTIPKVRALLFARLCLASSDHAAKAASLFRQAPGALDDSILRYADDLRRTARARAARFLAIDAELSGKTGEGIAWLKGGRKELGFAVDVDDAGKRKGLKGFKQSWAEKREDRRVEKGAEGWGMDAGRLEEARVLEWLEARWAKMNDTINVQAVPPWEPLLASMPSGREYHTPKTYSPPTLDRETLHLMRAPPDPDLRAFTGNEVDSDDGVAAASNAPVGAFPGTAREYGSDRSYY
ncbi:hypothetical protein MBLNU459_g6777t1 [Dothideomycetes sp. NU459]